MFYFIIFPLNSGLCWEVGQAGKLILALFILNDFGFLAFLPKSECKQILVDLVMGHLIEKTSKGHLYYTDLQQ